MKCCYSLMVLAALVSWGWGHSLCGDAEQCRGAGLAEDKMAQMFRDFMKTYNKTYKDQKEEKRRFKIFVENAEKVRLLQESEEGTARYGVTKFSDISADEFTHGSLKPVAKESCEKVSFSNPLNNLSEAMDWRKLHAVTPVKDQQQQCKCCWAFAVVGNVESQWFIKKQKLISLAEQELLDCGAQTNNCSGGQIDVAFQDVEKLGLEQEDSYPYKGQQSKCNRDNEKSVVKIKKCVWLPSDERVLKQYVALNGTITVLMDLKPLQHYKKGIIRSNSCTKISNHAVLIVGYGIESNMPYWIIKNSWGAAWGEEGYARIYRGNNACGISKYAMSSIV